MAHGNLLDGESGGARAHEDFGVDERADGLDRDGIEYIATEDLEGAVDVTNAQPENDSDQQAPTACE